MFNAIDPLAGKTICDIIANITAFIRNIGIALVVVYIIIGAFQFLTSQGGQGVKKGAETLKWSVIGLAVILFAQGLVYAVLEVLGSRTGACVSAPSVPTPPPSNSFTPLPPNLTPPAA
ncbi:MAG: hypothetical protein KGI50_02100 [Patescibacteria group bacterium]|nr:hypothetical protein [Patescibacteria group bacterium]MDE2437862.1 hypothetical protein [Patescibacteria group bacterium]